MNLILSLGSGSDTLLPKLKHIFPDRPLDWPAKQLNFLTNLLSKQAVANDTKSLPAYEHDVDGNEAGFTPTSVLASSKYQKTINNSNNSSNSDIERFFPQKPADADAVSPNQPVLTSRLPLAGEVQITSEFGWRTHPMLGNLNFHHGIDFGAAEGTPVLAVKTGKVTRADWNGGYGLMVVLEHDRGTTQTVYAHLSKILVQPGDIVQPGQEIGRVGSTGYSTGPHLHFEQRQLTAEGWLSVDPSSVLDHHLVGSNSFSETPVTESTASLMASNLPPQEINDRDRAFGTKDPTAMNISPVKSPEFDRWVTQLNQEFTNLNTKTLNSADDYPQTACEQKLAGTVEIGVFVNAWGQIMRDPQILNRSGHEMLDRAAVNYIKNFRLPETDQPTAYQYIFQFNYDENTCIRQNPM